MAITATTVESEVAYFLGYGYTAGATGHVRSFVENIVDRAMRQFVMPSPIDGESSAHKWSWLTGTDVLVLNDPVTFSHSSTGNYRLNSTKL